MSHYDNGKTSSTSLLAKFCNDRAAVIRALMEDTCSLTKLLYEADVGLSYLIIMPVDNKQGLRKAHGLAHYGARSACGQQFHIGLYRFVILAAIKDLTF